MPSLRELTILILLKLTITLANEVYVTEQKVSLQCPFTNITRGGIIEWYSDKTVINGGSNLTLNDSYSCSLTKDTGKVLYSCPLLVRKASISWQFLKVPVDTAVYTGYTAVLECSPPLSFPSPIVTWIKDGIPLDLSSPRYLLAPSGNLYIYSTTPNDKGLYKCVAYNPFTFVSRESTGATLTVTNNFRLLYPFKFILHPRNATVLKGTTHTLECLINVLNPLTWTRPGHNSLPLSANSSLNGFLVFNSVQESDGGLYRCEYNPGFGGPLISDAYITVVGPPNVTLSTNKVVTNLTLGFTCATPLYSLPANVTVIVGGETIFNYTTYFNGTYNFDISIDDYMSEEEEERSVWVQCIITNEYGCHQDSLQLNIIDDDTVSVTHSYLNTTSISLVPSLINSSSTTKLMTSLKITQYNDTILHCTVIPPNTANTSTVNTSTGTIRWVSLLRGEVLTGTEVVVNSSMIVSQLKLTNSGSYYCYWTGNYMSSNVLIIPLRVHVSQPVLSVYEGRYVNLTCSFNGGRLDSLSWTRQGVSLSSFINESTIDSTVSILLLGPLHKADHTGLYQCKGAVGSNVVIGNISLHILIPPPSHSPQSLHIKWSPNTRLIVLSWRPPPSNNNILGYKLNWGLYSNGHLSQSARVALPPTSLNYSLTNSLFVINQTYSFSVWAYTIGGDGPSIIINQYLTDTPLPVPSSVVVSMVTTSTMTSLATPTPSNKLIPMNLVCHALTPYLGRIEIKNFMDAYRYIASYECTDGSHGNQSLSLFNTRIPLYGLRAGTTCNVTVVQYDSGVISGRSFCVITTPTNNNDNNNSHVHVNIKWNQERLLINWTLSQWISTLGALLLEWRPLTSSQWKNITNNNNNVLMEAKDYQEGTIIQVRITLNTRLIYHTNITLSSPPSPSPSLSSSLLTTPTHTPNVPTGYYGDAWLTYGIGIVVLIMVCLLALLVVLVLKYIQTSRREKAKVTDRRAHRNVLQTSPSCQSSDTSTTTDLKRHSLSSSAESIKIIKVRRLDTDV